ncbi:MAG: hypothetical protein A2275_08025 [Bacteroidetes bacterium RIFOXYA12_FULL_35_11]|nr:MAG: hypothetical protein A2X01_07905 [Bacteroidetes bacterium GWF2_35_48]OFY78684.1 MAG: hypothetical protein A2275_08025 [Bacteroidetes bacterium RIFOXYA12_FULL_35_11]
MNMKMKIQLLFIYISFFLLFANSCTQNNSFNGKSIDSLSVDEITTSLHEFPDDAALYFARAKKYSFSGSIDEAIADMNQAILKKNLKPEYFILLADLHLMKGQSGNSRDALEKCIKEFPSNTEVLLRLAQLHFYVKQYKKSFEYLNRVQEIDPTIAQTYFIRGLVLEEAGDTTNAIINFQISTEKNPDYYEAYIILGLRYADKKDSIALDYYRNALKIKPKSAEAYYNIGLFYQSIEKFNKAIVSYNELLEKADSTYKFALFNIGYIYMEYFKEYGKAIYYFQKANDADIKYFQASYNLGLCYERLKDYKKAKELYRYTLSVEPGYELAIQGLKRIR